MTTIADAFLAAWWAPVVAAPFVGSFLGVLIVRLPSGGSVAWSRSRCPHCRRTLRATDLIPLISWMASRGRCRSCGARLGLFYPAVELAAAGLASWAAAVVPGGADLWLSCVLGWTLLTLAVIDWRHLLLPDVLTLPLLAAGLALAAVQRRELFWDHAVGAAVGLVVFLAVARLYRAARGREGLGAGDAKVLAAAGAWVTWFGLPGVVLLGATSALTGVLAQRACGIVVSVTDPIPFGAYLCLGFWLVWLYGPLIVTWPA